MGKISIKIDGRDFSAEPEKSILDAAKENKIEIPSLCFHPDIETKHHCGMCAVRIAGEDELKYACATPIKEGMEIITDSEEITEARKKSLDRILKKHLLECDDCVWFQHCRLLDLVKKFEAKPIAEKDDKNQVFQVDKIIFDQTKCIGCENCIGICPTKFLEMDWRDKVNCSADADKDCINCGQCILHCPVGAIEGVGEFEELDKIFKDKQKIAVVQFAPSIRTSIGEEFGMKTGEIVTGQLVSGLKKLGFDYVFDTAAGADFTTWEEADELAERLAKNEKLPAMSSCCPSWVRFLEFEFPEFIPNLCTSRSPQTMLGGVIKSHWAKQNNIESKNIFAISIMPCTAKKYEIKREELKIDGIFPVDMVLTTRELVRLFKKNNINLEDINERETDNPFGAPSGAGVIYGSSGGVFESAFRTAYFRMTGENLPKDAVSEIRGEKGIKTKEINVGKRVVKICVVSGIKNARKVLEELKKNPQLYDAVEVMACPGGCVGGGGQSLPTNKKIVAERSKSLYNIDERKTIKCAHENPDVKKVYAEFFTSEETRRKILHTNFSPRNKTLINKIKNSRETYE
ncbi:MAG TPA: [FeFe] hydrogenase, group A [Candidatus Moranbacteria bacterium]|nr:[FeFe] hydrogenase, group A [Candidatus Moranbacteria bacterium]HSA08521.1 [FeFe] hydrogenase, group A [Candidatus Moranbacteria bacterium]